MSDVTSLADCSTPARDFADLTDKDPFAFYDRCREQAALVWDEGAQAWLVTTYDACREVEMEEGRFRHPYADPIPYLREIKGGDTITVLQGERHDRMHRFVLSLFAPKHLKDYRRDHVVPIIEELLARLEGQTRVELTSHFSDLLPPRVIMSLLNMPWGNDSVVRRVLDLHDVMMEWASGQKREEVNARAIAASEELNQMLLPFVRERRVNPGTDLISRVWTGWPTELGAVDEAEAQAICREMFMAGSETTVHALANALHILLTDQTVRERVRADRGPALAALVEESLRLFGAVQYRFRIANEDCTVGGVAVAKNQTLILVNSAANRDPARFEAPEQVNLDRRLGRDHLAFNVGPRVCVGAALARAEMLDALGMLLDAFPEISLDPEAPPPAFPGHFNRSFRPLNVILKP